MFKANEQRDYRIFEDFAYNMIAEARRKRATKVFDLDGNVYAFDSTTLDLCLSLFEWAKFCMKKGEIKVHALFDVEAGVPTFAHITEAKVKDINAMDEILMKLARTIFLTVVTTTIQDSMPSICEVLHLSCVPRKTSILVDSSANKYTFQLTKKIHL